MSRNTNIDAQRGLAIIAVVQHHLLSKSGAYETLGLPKVVCDVLDFGWAGVDLFFVLSAYLLTANLLRHRDAPGVVTAFYKRRALRILPLYWLLISTGFALHAGWRATGGTDDVALWYNEYPLWVYLAFLQNWVAGLKVVWVALFYAPTWSLAVEEHFYLVLPWLVLWLPHRRLALVAGVAILAAPLIRVGLDSYVNANAAYAWSISRIDAFGWGILLALAPTLWPRWLAAVNARWAVAAAASLAIAMACVPSLIGVSEASHSPSGLALTATALIAALATLAAMTLRAAGPPTIFAPVRLALVWCGERCYSLYLLHMPVLGLIFLAFGALDPRVTNASGVVLAVLALVLTVTLADVTYRHIEQPFMALAERMTPYRTSGVAKTSATTTATAA